MTIVRQSSTAKGTSTTSLSMRTPGTPPSRSVRLGAAAGTGPMVGLGLSLSFVAAGVIYDLVSRGRVHPAYVWGGTLLALSIPARLALSGTTAWRAVAEAMAR